MFKLYNVKAKQLREQLDFVAKMFSQTLGDMVTWFTIKK